MKLIRNDGLVVLTLNSANILALAAGQALEKIETYPDDPPTALIVKAELDFAGTITAEWGVKAATDQVDVFHDREDAARAADRRKQPLLERAATPWESRK